MRVLSICLPLLVCLLGCKPAPMKNTVVVKAESPDRKSSAVLVDRYYQAARVPDEFFLIVIPSGQDANEAINTRHIGDSSALVAIWASKVQLRWQSADTLLVVCDSCGLKPIDISKKLDHVGSIKIVYQGFPAGTARFTVIAMTEEIACTTKFAVSAFGIAPKNGINMENGIYTLHVNVSTTSQTAGAVAGATGFCTTYPTVCAGATTALTDLLAPFAVLSPLIMLQGDNTPVSSRWSKFPGCSVQYQNDIAICQQRKTSSCWSSAAARLTNCNATGGEVGSPPLSR
jgi:hypothetical protein